MTNIFQRVCDSNRSEMHACVFLLNLCISRYVGNIFNTCKTDNLIRKDVFSCLHSTWNFNWMKYFLFFNCKQRKTRVLHCNCYSCCNPVRFNRWRWCQPSGGINAVRLSRGSRCGAFSFSQNDAKLNSEHNKHLAEEISSPYQSDAVKETDYQRQTKLPSLKAASAVQ